MIHQLKIRKLLRKTENKFISDHKVSHILNVDRKTAIEILTYLENAGYIEEAGVDGFWQHSLRGKLLAHKRINREFRVITLQRQLSNFIKRVKTVNSSKAFPDYVSCAIVTSEYPIKHQGGSINIAYSLDSKGFSKSEYNIAANNLRKQHKAGFDNIVEGIAYPHEAIRLFLKSRSPILKLRHYSKEETKSIVGHKILG